MREFATFLLLSMKSMKAEEWQRCREMAAVALMKSDLHLGGPGVPDLHPTREAAVAAATEAAVAGAMALLEALLRDETLVGDGRLVALEDLAMLRALAA